MLASPHLLQQHLADPEGVGDGDGTGVGDGDGVGVGAGDGDGVDGQSPIAEHVTE